MENQKKESNIHGVSVRRVNFAIMALSVLLYAALLAVSFHAAGEYTAMKAATDLYISCQENAALVTEGSDYLTEQVRMFTFTLKPEYMENYFHEIHVNRRRELALEHLSEQAGDTARGYLSKALERSNQLTELEIYAMRLAAEAEGLSGLPQEVEDVELFPGHKGLSDEEKIDLARDKVFGEEYQAKKALINDNVTAFINDVMSSTHYTQETAMSDLSRAMTTQRVAFSLLLLLNIAIFIMIIVLIIKPLRVYIKCIREDRRMEITGAYEFKYLALTYNNIYELNTVNEVLLRHQAEHDPMTGLPSREAFDKAIGMLQVKPRPLALLLIDVDGMEQINSSYGRETGNGALKRVARILDKDFRVSDFPARVGGDKFAVIIDGVGPEKQKALCRKMRDINRRLSRHGDGLPPVSLSIGGAFSQAGFTDGLYQQAQAALYDVKAKGRMECRFYEEGMKLPVKPIGF